MADKTTLRKCAEFFEKHEDPDNVVYDKTSGCWLFSDINDRASMAIQAVDVAILLKEHLWEILQKQGGDCERTAKFDNRGVFEKYTLRVWKKGYLKCWDYEGGDELALLLSAAEEAMK